MSEFDDEILILREELYESFCSKLCDFYQHADVARAKHYFLAMPNESRKGRHSIEILFECCRCAKDNRLSKDRK